MAISTVLPSATSVSSDTTLEAFLAPTFDAAEYLNSTLPSLHTGPVPAQPPTLSTNGSISTSSSTTSTARLPDRLPLSELATQSALLLSRLDAQTARLTDQLTQLTDEMIRSGARLAYEVEMLRAEVQGLDDSMAGRLAGDLALFVPRPDAARQGAATSKTQAGDQVSDSDPVTDDAVDSLDVSSPPPLADEPPAIAQLQSLGVIRGRLDSVIRLFGDALAWPLAPSALASTGAGAAGMFISVSAPSEGSSGEDVRVREEKGRDVAEKLRGEVEGLLVSAGTGTGISMGSGVEGLERAANRVEDLRALAVVWRGTGEERARTRFVDELGKMVEEARAKVVKRDGRRAGAGFAVIGQAATVGAGGMRDTPQGSAARQISEGGGYGFMSSLRKIRGDIYVD